MGESFEPGHWSVDMEVNLFHAMRGHKPVGVNRHFNMVAIYDKLCNPKTKTLTAQNVWQHLATMYDLQALNESEIIPFPNKQVDFKLPDGEYSQLTDSEFPRMHKAVEEVKPKLEVTAQPKGSKSDPRTLQSGKLDHKIGFPPSDAKGKTDHKSGSQTSSKSDCKTPVSSRADGKGVKGVSSAPPSASPAKRTKRSRNTPAPASSPASEAGTSSAKRRR